MVPAFFRFVQKHKYLCKNVSVTHRFTGTPRYKFLNFCIFFRFVHGFVQKNMHSLVHPVSMVRGVTATSGPLPGPPETHYRALRNQYPSVPVLGLQLSAVDPDPYPCLRNIMNFSKFPRCVISSVGNITFFLHRSAVSEFNHGGSS